MVGRCGHFLGVLFVGAVASAATLSIDSRATYLRTEGDSALDSFAFPLASLGISPGDLVRIERVGFYTPLASGYPDSVHYLNGVFSGSSTLIGSTFLNRLPGAIDAGVDVVTPNTWNGGLGTDITQDFAIDDGSTFSFVDLRVPVGAAYIFFTANDSMFGDNGDPNGDFDAVVSVIPEPSAAAIAGLGLICGLARGRWTRVWLAHGRRD